MNQKKLTNLDILRSVNKKTFSNLVYHFATVECKSLKEFEELMEKEFPPKELQRINSIAREENYPLFLDGRQ